MNPHPPLRQTTRDGIEIVSVPLFVEIPVDPLDGFTPEEASAVALQRLRDLPLSVTLGGVPLAVRTVDDETAGSPREVDGDHPGARVRVIADSAYRGRCGTVRSRNEAAERWMVAIDDDREFSEVSFYRHELEILAGAGGSRPAVGKPGSQSNPNQ